MVFFVYRLGSLDQSQILAIRVDRMFLVTFSSTLLHTLWKPAEEVNSVFCISLQEQNCPTSREPRSTPFQEREKEDLPALDSALGDLTRLCAVVIETWMGSLVFVSSNMCVSHTGDSGRSNNLCCLNRDKTSLDSRLTSNMSNSPKDSLEGSLLLASMMNTNLLAGVMNTSLLCSPDCSNSLSSGSSNSKLFSMSTLLLLLSVHDPVVLGNRDIIVTVIVVDQSVHALLTATCLDAADVVRIPFTS